MSSEFRALKTKQSSDQPSSMITSLPDDVIIDILARVPRCNYRKLSLVSKHFRSIVSSVVLYERRILLGCTEACIYAVIGYNCYILRRTGKSNRLVPIQLPFLPCLESFVSVGSKIYVLGRTNYHEMKLSGLCIDCTSHAMQALPRLPRPMVVLSAGIIDVKIYVIGYSDKESKNFMVVFNTETQMWETEMKKLDMKLGYMKYGFVAMADKIYIRDNYNSFVYKPKESKWETDEILNSKQWCNACVIDDLLCYYDYYENELRAYDTKQRLWRVVKGVAEMSPDAVYWEAHTVSYGGKLAVFLHVYDTSSKTKKICCVLIALERSEEEIWGKVEWRDVVIEGDVFLKKSLVVMV